MECFQPQGRLFLSECNVCIYVISDNECGQAQTQTQLGSEVMVLSGSVLETCGKWGQVGFLTTVPITLCPHRSWCPRPWRAKARQFSEQERPEAPGILQSCSPYLTSTVCIGFLTQWLELLAVMPWTHRSLSPGGDGCFCSGWMLTVALYRCLRVS